MQHILTLTLNPSVDLSAATDLVRPEHKLRCRNPQLDPGGGGINVSRVAKELGALTLAIFPEGGATGTILMRALSAMGIASATVHLRAHTRLCINIGETRTGDEYRFVMPGVPIQPDELDACLALVEAELDPGGVVVGSGSLPPGAPDDTWAVLAHRVKRKGGRLVLDTSGPALRVALGTGIYLLKPSRREFAELLGEPLDDVASLASACRRVQRDGAAELIVVSMGKEGALLTTPTDQWLAVPPTVQPKSAVGAGDSFVAGMTVSLLRGDAPETALTWGTAAGAASLLAPGTGLCALADVERLRPLVEIRRVDAALRRSPEPASATSRPRAPGGAVPIVSSATAATAGRAGSRRNDMEFANIKDVPIPASRIGLGTWAMGGYQWGGTDDDESVRTIHAAMDRGVTTIDTAPAYGFGHSEEVVGRAVAERGNRDKVVLATKVGLERQGDRLYRNSTRKQVFAEVEASLKRLRTDYVDLYQVHWPDPEVPFEDTARALLDLKQAGKVRAVGVSNYSIPQMEHFSRVCPIATAQPPLNLFERQAQADILPWCASRGVGAITYGALCRGLLSGAIDDKTKFSGDDLRLSDPKFQQPRFSQYLAAIRELERFAHERYDRSLLALAVRWVLDQEGVYVALWGPRHPHELDPLDEVLGWHLDADSLKQIDEILARNITDPVGPEFMAPPMHKPDQPGATV